jgi:hypothetical protein
MIAVLNQLRSVPDHIMQTKRIGNFTPNRLEAGYLHSVHSNLGYEKGLLRCNLLAFGACRKSSYRLIFEFERVWLMFG